MFAYRKIRNASNIQLKSATSQGIEKLLITQKVCSRKLETKQFEIIDQNVQNTKYSFGKCDLLYTKNHSFNETCKMRFDIYQFRSKTIGSCPNKVHTILFTKNACNILCCIPAKYF